MSHTAPYKFWEKHEAQLRFDEMQARVDHELLTLSPMRAHEVYDLVFTDDEANEYLLLRYLINNYWHKPAFR